MNKVKVVNEQYVAGVPKKSAHTDLVSLDDWIPSPKVKRPMVPSEWRQRQNQGKGRQVPSLDDIRKIKSLLHKGARIDELAKVFNVTRRAIIEIAEGRFRIFGAQG